MPSSGLTDRASKPLWVVSRVLLPLAVALVCLGNWFWLIGAVLVYFALLAFFTPRSWVAARGRAFNGTQPLPRTFWLLFVLTLPFVLLSSIGGLAPMAALVGAVIERHAQTLR
jgi:hypothetical protein